MREGTMKPLNNFSVKRNGFGPRVIESLTPKTVFALILGAAAWHYGDLIAVKEVHAEVSAEASTFRQQNRDHDAHLKSLDETVSKKVDRDTYDRDVRNMTDSLNRIQVSIDAIHQTLEERR